MDYRIVIAGIVLIAAIGGFVVLARTLLENWRARSRGDEESHTYENTGTSEFEKCYDDCMSMYWDPEKSRACESICHARVDAEPGA